MFCHKCGNQIAEDVAFCQKCGAKLCNEETIDTTSYDVILAMTDWSKINEVMAAVHKLIVLEIEEPIFFVDSLPITLLKDVTKSEAESTQETLSRIGAVVILKCCSNCGKPLTEDSKRCGTCEKMATALPPVFVKEKASTEVSPLALEPSILEKPRFGCVYCPKCKSQKLQTLVETNAEAKGGYGAVRGCLGFLILGPLGLLCGACGSKTKIKTTYQTFFMCMDCGNKFRESKELMDETSKTSELCFIGSPFAFAFGLLLLLSGAIALGLFGIALGGFLILCGFIEKKQSEEIKTKGYEALCYMNQKNEK